MENPLSAEILDLVKENVQPLRHGRRAAQLSTVLHAMEDVSPEAQKQLDEQREQYELMIRLYEGEDPLEPRYHFVQWIEQSYAELGPKSKLILLLEDTINLFKEDKRYRQDQRFIEILVKYINCQTNPLELYQLSYNQGLGTMCAILYLAWAEELDKNQDWKRANQIYETGIMVHAEPIDELKRAHEQFQLSVGRRMMNGESASPVESSVSAPSRQALSKIKKAQVAGTRVPQGNPGILKSQPFVMHNRQTTIPIFQENSEENLMAGGVKAQLDHFPKAVVTNKENSLMAGTWKNKHGSRSSSSIPVPSTPSFHVHVDEQVERIHHQTPIVPRALKSIKSADIVCPVAIFEAPDPTKKAMYPKHKVYVGGGEFQLEEVRAAVYNKRHAIETGQTERYEFQTPMHFGKMFTGQSAMASSTPLSYVPETKALPVRLFVDHSDNSDAEDEEDKESIRCYRNDKNVISEKCVAETTVVGEDTSDEKIACLTPCIGEVLKPSNNCKIEGDKLNFTDNKEDDSKASSSVFKGNSEHVDLSHLRICETKKDVKVDEVLLAAATTQKKPDAHKVKTNIDQSKMKKKTAKPCGKLPFAIFTE